MNEREELAAFFSSIRNWDHMSTLEAIKHFEKYREEMIKKLNLTEDEMHDAWIKRAKLKKSQKE